MAEYEIIVFGNKCGDKFKEFKIRINVQDITNEDELETAILAGLMKFGRDNPHPTQSSRRFNKSWSNFAEGLVEKGGYRVDNQTLEDYWGEVGGMNEAREAMNRMDTFNQAPEIMGKIDAVKAPARREKLRGEFTEQLEKGREVQRSGDYKLVYYPYYYRAGVWQQDVYIWKLGRSYVSKSTGSPPPTPSEE